ncbi:MAG: DEAD/DEAH box helicase, partial [Nanoarchaeota archaeon]|nr:DEAD/DEAH box helicase [Nanoarchaeota archaeon]
MQYKGLTLDEFQEDSIKAIDNNHSVVVSAPTGSGKTLIADYIINKDVKKGIRVIYTAPIKALSNQKYKEFVADYGEEKVGLLTGDIVINPGGLILVMTTEVYRNMAITKDHMIDSVSYVVLDEIHYINDIERGSVWEESIIFSDERVRFLCLSATIPNAKEFASWIQSIKNHTVEVIRHNSRNVPLHKNFYDSELGITT